jgi:hypothetical protein
MMIKNISNLLLWGGALAGGGSGGGGGDTPSGGEEWIGDGNTHIWISLPEGRTSLAVCVSPNGTVTVDWGDGSTPDVLTGTSTSSGKRTPVHNYASAGDYVITLTVDGTLALKGSGGNSYGYLLSTTSVGGQGIDSCALNSIKRIEFGSGVSDLGDYALGECRSLKRVRIPNGVTNIGQRAFYGCSALEAISVPNSVATIGKSAFYECSSLEEINLPDGITDIGSYMFYMCYALKSINIPNGVTTIGTYAFQNCRAVSKVSISKNVTSIAASAFANVYSCAWYDFTQHTAVPTLANTSAFQGIPADCEIRVPAALVDEWKAATNWSTYAAKIVGV